MPHDVTTQDDAMGVKVEQAVGIMGMVGGVADHDATAGAAGGACLDATASDKTHFSKFNQCGELYWVPMLEQTEGWFGIAAG